MTTKNLPVFSSNAVELWRGPSAIDGQPIVVLLTGLKRGSNNTKTGAMLQTFILRQDIKPHLALKTGEDVSICGGCRHRPSTGGSCYVLVFQAPLQVYRAWKRGRYRRVIALSDLADVAAGRSVRLGAYGDPGAVPLTVWRELTKRASGWTGYTHQWRRRANDGLMAYCMASVDTVAEYEEAKRRGWGTFRVRSSASEPTAEEIVCPASAEAGHVATCATCLMCDGVAMRNIVIVAHGTHEAKFTGE